VKIIKENIDEKHKTETRELEEWIYTNVLDTFKMSIHLEFDYSSIMIYHPSAIGKPIVGGLGGYKVVYLKMMTDFLKELKKVKP
jgi:hypothetical protein